MTWNELDQRTNGDWFQTSEDLEFIGEFGQDNVYSCSNIDDLIRVLKEQDYGVLDAWGRLTEGEDIYEYKQNQQLINELENVR